MNIHEPAHAVQSLPPTLSSLIGRVSARNQIWLVILSGIVFLLSTAPLELQRRIVNDAFRGSSYRPIAFLCLLYLALAIVEGLIKLALNIYRGWVSENAVRWLRSAILSFVHHVPSARAPETRGIEISMVLAEAEPIGGFIGLSVSEPVLQGGILVSVLAYLTYIQPLMAVMTIAIFTPQFVFVPIIQNLINKRVQARIVKLRDVGGSMIEEPVPGTLQYERVDEVFALNFSIYRLKFSMNFLMNLLNSIGIAAILALGGYAVVKGDTQIGTVVAFISGLAKVNDPWGDLVNWFRDLRVTQAKYDLVRRAVEMSPSTGAYPDA